MKGKIKIFGTLVCLIDADGPDTRGPVRAGCARCARSRPSPPLGLALPSTERTSGAHRVREAVLKSCTLWTRAYSRGPYKCE